MNMWQGKLRFVRIFTLQYIYMLATMCSDIFPHYDPYVLPQVWADIPLKGVVIIL